MQLNLSNPQIRAIAQLLNAIRKKVYSLENSVDSVNLSNTQFNLSGYVDGQLLYLIRHKDTILSFSPHNRIHTFLKQLDRLTIVLISFPNQDFIPSVKSSNSKLLHSKQILRNSPNVKFTLSLSLHRIIILQNKAGVNVMKAKYEHSIIILQDRREVIQELIL